MRKTVGLIVFAVLALLPCIAEAADLPAKTASLCLAEVVSLKEVNEMPADGDWTVTATLKIIKSTGAAPQEFSLVKEYGGKRAPGLEPPVTSPLVPALAKNKKFWLAFSADKEILAWWPEDAPALKELEAAVREDRYRGNGGGK